ncbi:MAG: aminoglycoside adenylyltransferase domain-containing protein [Pseudomonadota bacterium]
MKAPLEQNESVLTYLEKVTSLVRDTLGQDLKGLYLHGSGAQSDYNQGTSDIDILGVVATGSISDAQRSKLVSRLTHDALPVPAKGLEIILCPEDAVCEPVLDLPFDFALSTGHSWPTQCEPRGTASDSLINITLCRQSGISLFGPPPDQVLAPVPRDLLREALIEEIEWHQQNLFVEPEGATPENAVLNAARSLYAAETGRILSKSEGARWWLERYPEDELVAGALAIRKGEQTAALEEARTRNFLARAKSLIEAMPPEPIAPRSL